MQIGLSSACNKGSRREVRGKTQTPSKTPRVLGKHPAGLVEPGGGPVEEPRAQCFFRRPGAFFGSIDPGFAEALLELRELAVYFRLDRAEGAVSAGLPEALPDFIVAQEGEGTEIRMNENDRSRLVLCGVENSENA